LRWFCQRVRWNGCHFDRIPAVSESFTFENGDSTQEVVAMLGRQPWHRKLTDLKPVEVPADDGALYEATCYAADNNAMEVRSIFRSGPTKLPSGEPHHHRCAGAATEHALSATLRITATGAGGIRIVGSPKQSLLRD
jgi:hypothetical protein